MDKMKKLKLLLANIILAGVLVLGGCADAGDSSQSSSSKETTSQESASSEDQNTNAEDSSDDTSAQADSGNTAGSDTAGKTKAAASKAKTSAVSTSKIPKYSGSPYIKVHNNVPFFKKSDLTKKVFEKYSKLDALGRCRTAYANVCKATMPTEKRGRIGMVKPSGWHTVKYNNVDGKYLYNRCHLIGYQLTAENANERNLMTGTRYLNVDGMLPFENMVADYVKETNNHVLYRVTPIYTDENLLADGVLMEAESVEDKGKGISYCVYVYNVQPGIKIDYETGDSSAKNASNEMSSGSSSKSSGNTYHSSRKHTSTQNRSGQSSAKGTYIINENTNKFHKPDCRSVKMMKDKNKKTYTGKRSELINSGYEPCKNCNP